MHIEIFYYYEGTLRQAGKLAQNSAPSFNWISHTGYVKKFLHITTQIFRNLSFMKLKKGFCSR